METCLPVTTVTNVRVSVSTFFLPVSKAGVSYCLTWGISLCILRRGNKTKGAFLTALASPTFRKKSRTFLTTAAPSSDCHISSASFYSQYLKKLFTHTSSLPNRSLIFYEPELGFHLHCSHGNCELRLMGTSLLQISSSSTISHSLLGGKKNQKPLLHLPISPQKQLLS